MAIPISGYHSYEQYVEDLSRAESFYCKSLSFKTIGKSTSESEAKTGMRRLVLAGGRDIHLILSQPLHEWSVAGLYLKMHPEGIGFLNFRVSDFDMAYQELLERNATLLFDPQSENDRHGQMRQMAIATALDDVSIRFIDDSQYDNFGPNFQMTQQAGSYESPVGFQGIDHMTANVKTLQPLMAFYEEVLGFERFWGIEFHTNDVNPNLPVGSGLKSTVMWHPESGVKFANNEPAPPFFRNSQIDIYLRDNVGSGIQHVAFLVPNIIETMESLHAQGAKFLPAPDKYYDQVNPRLEKSGFRGKIKEDRKRLAQNSILVDGSDQGYLLQIFSLEMQRMLQDPRGGALFYEIIQRAGDQGFGGGNFRALFETIEIDQIAMAKTATKMPLELI